MDTFIQQIINGLVQGGMYALVALGYTMVYGVLNLINFAHGDVLMIGALSGISILHLVQSFAPDLPGVVKVIIAILGAIPICALVNVFIERVAYRRLRNAPRLAPLITAIGMSTLLQVAGMLIWGRSPIPFPEVMPSESFQFFGAFVSPTQLMLVILAVLCMVGLVYMVERTRMGRAMRAVAENPRVAGLMGVDANGVIVLTFAIGAALAAVAGVMWSANYSSGQFAMGVVPGMKAFSAAVLGGIGNIYGAMVGGVVLGLLAALGAGYLGDLTGNLFGSQYQDVFAFLALILVLTLKPSGIMGERVADRA